MNIPTPIGLRIRLLFGDLIRNEILVCGFLFILSLYMLPFTYYGPLTPYFFYTPT